MRKKLKKLKGLQDTRFEKAITELARRRSEQRVAEQAVVDAEKALEQRQKDEKREIDELYEKVTQSTVKQKDIHKMNEKIKQIKQLTIEFATALANRRDELEAAKKAAIEAKKDMLIKQIKVEKYQYLLERTD